MAKAKAQKTDSVSKKPTKKGLNSGQALAQRQGVHIKLGIMLRAMVSSWAAIGPKLAKLPDEKRLPLVKECTDPLLDYPWGYLWKEGSALDQIFDPKKKEVRSSCTDMAVLRQAEREADRLSIALRNINREIFPRPTNKNKGARK